MRNYLVISLLCVLFYAPHAAHAAAIDETVLPVFPAEEPAMSRPVPQVVLETAEQNDITYVTGGVGKEEVEALKAMADKFNLRVLSSTEDGHYISNTLISIYDSNGGLVFEAPMEGPYLYALLPPGKFRVDAKQDEKVQSKNIAVKNKTQEKLGFVW